MGVIVVFENKILPLMKTKKTLKPMQSLTVTTFLNNFTNIPS